MALEVYANQPSTTVNSGGTDAPASGTQETWTVASSTAFPPAVTSVTQFHVADASSGASSEMIAVTNVSGTTWTVTRGAENTTPIAHSAGFTVYQVVTAGVMASFPQIAGPPPSGDTSGATDTANLRAALDAITIQGTTLQLAAGTYYTDAPIVLPAVPVSLAGQEGAMQSGAGVATSGGPLGTNFHPVTTWAQGGASVPAVIIGGASLRHNIQDIWIDGTDIAAITGVDGINISGTSNGGHSIYRCGIAEMTGWGVYVKAGLGYYGDTIICQFNAVNPSSEGVAGGGGYYCGSTDGYHHNVHSQTNAGIQIYINSGDNKLVACRADGVNWAGSTIGFFLNCFQGSGGLGIGIVLIGCSTQFNISQGVVCNGGGHNAYGPYQLIGCLFEGDGGSGSLGAVQAIGRVTVSVLGCDVATDNTGTNPAYAITTAQNSGTHAVPDLVQADGGGMWQVGTAFVNDAGPATKLVVGSSVQGFIGAQNGTASTTAFRTATTAVTSGSYLCPPSVYAPGTQTSLTTSSGTLSAVSSANVNTGAFTVPPSGSVVVTASFVSQANAVSSTIGFGLCQHGSTSPVIGYVPVWKEPSATQPYPHSLSLPVSGLAPAGTYNLDLMYAVTNGGTATVFANSQTSATPTLNTGGVGAPIVMTVQAV